MRFRYGITVCLLAEVMLPATATLHGQSSAPGRAGLSAERTTRARWLHGRQKPRFTVFRDSRHWIHVDSIEAGQSPRARTFHLRLTTETNDDATATLRVDDAGRWLNAVADFTEPLPSDTSALVATRHARWRLDDGTSQLSIPAARLWGFVPVVRVTRLARGVQWRDTFDLAADRYGFRQALRGVRTSVVLGDTVAGGRRLWIIGDSARVRYSERSFDVEYSLNAVVTIDRIAHGITRGRYLYDETLALAVVRHDSTVLTGDAVLTYPDRRSFRTPARYEAFGSWVIRDPTSHQRRVAEIRTDEEARETGIVHLPVSSVEQAISRGDARVRDSVFALWQRTTDPNEYERLSSVLSWGGDPVRNAVQKQRIASGDTAYDLERRRYDRLGDGRHLDIAELRTLLPFLEDPGLTFSLGVERDFLYDWIVQGLTDFAPAATPDTSAWPCTRSACRVLADQWRRMTDPRLRDIGLAALATTDPARWMDTLVAGASPGSGLLRSIRRQASVEWPAPGAEWHAWRRWVISDACYNSRCLSPMFASQETAVLLRLHQARGRRDLAREITTRFAVEPSDSAQLIFGVLRLAFDRGILADSIIAHLRSPSPPLRALGEAELQHTFEERSAPADSATVAEILDQYVAQTYTVSQRWQNLADQRAGRALENGPDTFEVEQGGFFSAEALPPLLRRKWHGQAPLISLAEWDARSLTKTTSLTSVKVDGQFGPIVRIAKGTTTQVPRGNGMSPWAYATGHTFYMVKLGGRWVVVISGVTWIS